MPSGTKPKKSPNPGLEQPPRGFLLGLTGGIATGKSTVAKLLAERGWAVVDADQINRTLIAPAGKAYAAVRSLLGPNDAPPSGQELRVALRERTFRDPEFRKQLERLLHPMILEASQEKFAKLRAQGQPVVYEASLLCEAGRANEMDAVMLVTAAMDLRLKRLMARDRVSLDEARRVVEAQWTDAQRRASIHVPCWELNNDSTENTGLKDLAAKLDALLAREFMPLRR